MSTGCIILFKIISGYVHIGHTQLILSRTFQELFTRMYKYIYTYNRPTTGLHICVYIYIKNRNGFQTNPERDL